MRNPVSAKRSRIKITLFHSAIGIIIEIYATVENGTSVNQVQTPFPPPINNVRSTGSVYASSISGNVWSLFQFKM